MWDLLLEIRILRKATHLSFSIFNGFKSLDIVSLNDSSMDIIVMHQAKVLRLKTEGAKIKKEKKIRRKQAFIVPSLTPLLTFDAQKNMLIVNILEP